MNRIEIIKADITLLKVDAIVNAANNSLTGGGGVDGAIHKAAGPELLAACIPLKGCATGYSKITAAYNLPSRFIIHSFGPVWNNGTQNEESLLKSCYHTAFELMIKHNLKTIAFPSISTGAYRFPFHLAAKIAYQTISHFLSEHDDIEKVFLVCYSDKDLDQFKRAISNL